MVLPLNGSGSQSNSNNFWIPRRIFNIVCPGNIIHSNSIGSPSILSNSLYCFVLMNHSNVALHSSFDWGNGRTFPIQSLWIHKLLHSRYGLSLRHSPKKRPFTWRSRRTDFWHSWDFQSLFLIQFLSHSEQFLYSWPLMCISGGVQILRVVLSKKTAAFTVEVMSIPHVRVCISISSILSPGGRFNIIRNRSFTLSLEKTDSAESILNSSDASKSMSMFEFHATGFSVPPKLPQQISREAKNKQRDKKP